MGGTPHDCPYFSSLLERVWDQYADPFTTVVKVTIRRLRTKLGDPPLIETVPQGGYRIAES